MKKLFESSSFKADDLMGYCRRIDALGHAISTLGFYENKNGSETLTGYGEELGMIVADYAKTINKALDGAYRVLNEFFECDGSLAHEVIVAHNEIAQMKDHSTALEAIEKNIQLIRSTGLDSLPVENLMQVMEIDTDLRRMRTTILKYQERKEQNGAPAKADNQNAEAPKADLNRSNNM